MENYYQVLELSPLATQEEIKTQYKQLVRIYHPDRFAGAQDKHLAEQKLKDINEAYRALSQRVVEAPIVKVGGGDWTLEVEPTALDFGAVPTNQCVKRTFKVSFSRGYPHSVDFSCSEDSWFKVVRVSHIYSSEASALELEVEAAATALLPQRYHGWVDISLDTALVRVPIAMHVVRSLWRYQRPALVTMTTLLTIVLLSLGTLAFTRVVRLTQTQVLASPATAQWMLNGEHELGFSLYEKHRFALYAAPLLQGQPRALGQTARPALIAPDGKWMAYIGADQSTLYLSDLQAVQIKTFFTGQEPKSRLQWSPDAKRLAYLAGKGLNARIGIYDLAADEERRLPGAVTAGVSHFAWSPDGQIILFDLWQNEERRVYRIDADGSGLEQLTHFDSWAGAWFPNGHEVVVGAPDGMYRLDLDGHDLQQITTMSGEEPQLSADGAWLACLAAKTQNGTRTLFLLQVESGRQQAVATDALTYAWSPEDNVLGYVTGRLETDPPLLYLWAIMPGKNSRLVAEVNAPVFHWLH